MSLYSREPSLTFKIPPQLKSSEAETVWLATTDGLLRHILQGLHLLDVDSPQVVEGEQRVCSIYHCSQVSDRAGPHHVEEHALNPLGLPVPWHTEEYEVRFI